MNKRAKLQKIMRDIDSIIQSAGVKVVNLNQDDFDLVAEYLKWDEDFYPHGIPYNGRLIKKVSVTTKRGN
jgi:hypothetical protein